ncbi:PadR family transcriptional regulator [Corynebacterium hylobatis]|uniref:PadR family transcriptional regulator n=1 Tax=Corynebacterium hylobatis TaxID=1859290 RepID=A0A430HV26_9CORY|nr:PadR family transcriptional regulator [Corynebacterium hylobatis]RSZ61443.1 PadR family transcriptional regulator [Corynebacterium hylobatis]
MYEITINEFHGDHGNDCGHRRGRGRGHRHHGRNHHGHGHGHGSQRRGRGRGGRAGRGDLRQVILVLLAEQPMHGYQLISEVGERTDGAWTPSPGGIYPNLSLLEDEGLITMSVEEGRKLATLTEAGRAEVASNHAEWARILDDYREHSDEDPRGRLGVALKELRGAVRRAGDDKHEAVAEIIARAAEKIRGL